ncbi:EMC3/TMCO1 family protein [Candidatus Poseidonia alphae]|nr:EMC3/TMCO1 family protein [Candidatus Poseidonia alphae]MDA8638669.1 EMC3/TMCO1 family protein [Candidatus Poseidonia alphae]MDA8749607.1 EMC3/TMCO1 family protein [Candidatus Poseidonia alphae]MDB2637145.1 EMC3/TMCO1 family protein [Candidatus Poseidonia alphae]MDC0625761.1 EMC3/TMCO1 family protein [Candidatus Poseidonia alphae]
MANGPTPPPPAPPGGSMFLMLIVMVMMTVLIMTPSIRLSLGTTADPILSPLLPEESFFVITVLILGVFSMTLNTVIRNFFVDPMDQAHIGHRQGQVRQIMNEARMSRDPILQEKAMTLQQQMMPEQLDVQMGAMKPMMFTMIFIIGIFAWLTTAVETFRVDYVSLPWAPEWNLLEDRFLFFPAWICCYISMSAAYGRVLDRHIKLARYKSHPLVLSGEVIKEPLLHLIATKPAAASNQVKKRQQRSQRRSQQNKKKTTSAKSVDSDEEVEEQSVYDFSCPECQGDVITHDGPRTKRCNVCFHEWV